ncbi:MAG TPA: hypothetical protein VIK86_00215 [Candidatus Paceibacterota bacterium]
MNKINRKEAEELYKILINTMHYVFILDEITKHKKLTLDLFFMISKHLDLLSYIKIESDETISIDIIKLAELIDNNKTKLREVFTEEDLNEKLYKDNQLINPHY